MKTKTTFSEAMQQAQAASTASSIAPSRRGKKAVVLYLKPETAKRLKVLAAENETTVHALGLEAFDLLFERYDAG